MQKACALRLEMLLRNLVTVISDLRFLRSFNPAVPVREGPCFDTDMTLAM